MTFHQLRLLYIATYTMCTWHCTKRTNNVHREEESDGKPALKFTITDLNDVHYGAGAYCPAFSADDDGVPCPPGFFCKGLQADKAPCTAAPGNYCPEGSGSPQGVPCLVGEASFIVWGEPPYSGLQESMLEPALPAWTPRTSNLPLKWSRHSARAGWNRRTWHRSTQPGRARLWTRARSLPRPRASRARAQAKLRRKYAAARAHLAAWLESRAKRAPASIAI